MGLAGSDHDDPDGPFTRQMISGALGSLDDDIGPAAIPQDQVIDASSAPSSVGAPVSTSVDQPMVPSSVPLATASGPASAMVPTPSTPGQYDDISSDSSGDSDLEEPVQPAYPLYQPGVSVFRVVCYSYMTPSL